MMKKEEVETGSHVNNDMGKDKSTADECDPWNTPYPPYDSSIHEYSEWRDQRNAFLKTTRATNIIIPDRIPETVNSDFYTIYSDLLPILKADSALRFRRFFDKRGEYMTYAFIIIPEAFDHIIIEDAVRCAQVALEGKAPELEGFRANPNCMNKLGYFPLHGAAERFSVDMIKLLLRHGASANLRTRGDVVKNLLPLHVAVENTCLHKYLEDNLLPEQKHPDYPTKKDTNYVYKIVHLLCLPEMKFFLDTTRLLAEYTNNLVDEIWNYMENGELLETAVLLLAAQAHIRVGSTCKGNGNGDIDGFSTLINRISERCKASQLEMGQNDEEQLYLEVLSSAKLLLNIVAKAGQALDSYIQKHQENSIMQVPQANVLRHVSDILNIYGFSPTGEGNHSGNFCPYKWRPTPNGQLTKKHGNTVATEATAKTPHLDPADKKKAARHKRPIYSERECAWKNFFPYRRSVLACRLIKVNPAPAQFTPLHQSRKLFGTVALTTLKVLKNA